MKSSVAGSLHLGIMFLKIHVHYSMYQYSFLLIADNISCMNMPILSIHQLMDIGLFTLLSYYEIAIMWVYTFISSGYILKSGINCAIW